MGVMADKFSDVRVEKAQREDVISAQSCISKIIKCVNNELKKFNDLKTSGSFNTIDADIKTFLLNCETLAKQYQTAFRADNDVIDVFPHAAEQEV